MTTKKIDGNTFVFVNESKGNRAGFYHRTRLYMNDNLIADRKAQYYNRTWESYAFQSVMKWAVSDVIESRKNELISDYKSERGLKRLSKDIKEQIVNDDDLIGVYSRLTDEL